MENEKRFFARFRSRHIKYLALIDYKISNEDLIRFLNDCQRFWGGGYTVVVPIEDGEILDKYKFLAYAQDPDYVLYQSGHNIDSIKSFFNPIEFIPTFFGGFTNLLGVDIEHMLEIHNGYNGVVHENYLYKAIPELYDFYKLNFGFLNNPEFEFSSKYEKYEVGDADYSKLNDLFMYKNVCLPSELCRYNVARSRLIPEVEGKTHFEIIVADADNTTQDLLYFWNRHHFLTSGHIQNALYINTKELASLLAANPSPYFFKLLSKDDLYLKSATLSEEKLKEIAGLINRLVGFEKVVVGEKVDFPFAFRQLEYLDNDELESSRTLFGVSDVVQLPSLTFGRNNPVYGKWMVDFYILNETVNGANTLTILPPKPKLNRLFTSLPSRIQRGSMTVQVSKTEHEISLAIPDEYKLIKGLLLSSQSEDTPITKLETSDDGKRLASLLRLFGNHFNILNSFLRNEFWLNVFSRKSCVAKDEDMKSSKGVYSLKDLVREYKFTCDKHNFECNTEKLSQAGSQLRKELDMLIEKGAMFIGYKVKCAHCGSNSWYSLSEINYSMSCKGCQGEISFESETTPYYKVNDIITNNLLSSGKTKEFQGNYSVFLALAHFKEVSYHSFLYCPPQNFYNATKIGEISDIDVVCVEDGHLIIGESKNSVTEFTKKERTNLAYLIDRIAPDKVILVFNTGNESSLTDFIDKLKTQINNKFIPIETFKVPEPYFHHNEPESII